MIKLFIKDREVFYNFLSVGCESIISSVEGLWTAGLENNRGENKGITALVNEGLYQGGLTD